MTALFPHLPDVSLCNFWFFGWSKDGIRGQVFLGPESVREFLVD
jgi:putative lipase involved disintegration of autophagic bodies